MTLAASRQVQRTLFLYTAQLSRRWPSLGEARTAHFFLRILLVYKTDICGPNEETTPINAPERPLQHFGGCESSHCKTHDTDCTDNDPSDRREGKVLFRSFHSWAAHWARENPCAMNQSDYLQLHSQLGTSELFGVDG